MRPKRAQKSGLKSPNKKYPLLSRPPTSANPPHHSHRTVQRLAGCSGLGGLGAQALGARALHGTPSAAGAARRPSPRCLGLDRGARLPPRPRFGCRRPRWGHTLHPGLHAPSPRFHGMAARACHDQKTVRRHAAFNSSPARPPRWSVRAGPLVRALHLHTHIAVPPLTGPSIRFAVRPRRRAGPACCSVRAGRSVRASRAIHSTRRPPALASYGLVDSTLGHFLHMQYPPPAATVN
ncbi:hypothetical protein K438DRAFT_1957173 [Mycena galopus ATCC 62051]|nr:hypothetical protein K438DRAFT_1957173 [Mycena galopus ATCC 62051]